MQSQIPRIIFISNRHIKASEQKKKRLSYKGTRPIPSRTNTRIEGQQARVINKKSTGLRHNQNSNPEQARGSRQQGVIGLAQFTY
jgi:hypothetical protein